MPDKPGQQAYWNENVDPSNLGGEFDPRRFRLEEEMSFYLIPDQKQALEEMAPLEGKRILEVGAGVGANTLYLADHQARVFAIDIAHERLVTLRALARQTLGPKAGALFFVQCSADALPFREGVFDHVYSKAVLIHTRLEQSLPEARRVLRCGGLAVFLEPLTGNPLANLYRNSFAPRIWKQITRYFSREELEMVREQFCETRVRYYYLFSFLAFFWQFAVRSPRLFRLFLAPMHGVDSLLLRAFPFLRRYAWFAAITARR